MTKNQPNIGRIGWIDLSVRDAPRLVEFYEKVVGWKISTLRSGEVDDFCLNIPSDGTTVAGICQALGDNAKLPPYWLVYVNVANVQESVERVKTLGGKVIDGPRKLGERDFCCIQDPAGAYLALIEADVEG